MEKRPIHPYFSRSKWRERLDYHLRKNSVTESDAELITLYIETKKISAGGSLSESRKVKIVNHLVNFSKHFMRPYVDYRTLSDVTLATSVGLLIDEGKNPHGGYFSENTKHDYVVILKGFLRWMVKKRYSSGYLTAEGISDIGTPKKQIITKAPEDLLKDDDIYALLSSEKCSIELAALIAVLYWTGARIGEVLSLRWKDLTFEDRLLKTRIYASKTDTYRYSPCSEALQYVASWRAHYPKSIAGGPVGDNLVFVSLDYGTNTYVGMQYANARKQIQLLCDSVLHRHIKLHVFRASDITNRSVRGVSDAVNKRCHWGNQNTNMLSTYLLLNDNEVDTAMLQCAGLEVKKDLLPQQVQCGSCYMMNPPGSEFCCHCGAALTHQRQTKQIELREVRKEIEERENIIFLLKTAAEYLGLPSKKINDMLYDLQRE